MKPKKKKQISLVIPEQPTPTPSPAPVSAPAEPVKVERVDHAELAEQIADQLGEVKPFPRGQIKRIIWALGHDQAQALLQRAQEIEASGGQLVKDGKRRRTIGGVFFSLAYDEGKPLKGRELTRPEWNPKKKKATQAESETLNQDENKRKNEE